MKSRTLPLNKRGFSFETIMWLFTRLSALAMYGLALIGLVGALWMGARYQMNFADVMRWVFTSNVFHVQNTNVEDLAPWITVFWKLVASAMVLVATAHGVHGLVVVADDYLVKSWQRKFVRFLSMVAMVGMSLVGLYILWS
jgi:succinate dehydrogenase hydrophobic anchor subunit